MLYLFRIANTQISLMLNHSLLVLQKKISLTTSYYLANMSPRIVTDG